MRGVLRLLWPFTRGRRRVLAGGLAGTLLVTASELARPFPLKLVLDRLLGADASAPVDATLVITVAVLVVAIAVTGAAGTYLAETGMRRSGEHVVHDLRVALYTHLQRLTLRYHRRRHPGDLVTRLTGDVNAVGELVTESLVKVVGAVLLLAGMAVVSLALDPVLTLAAAGVIPLLAVATVRSRRTIKAAARRQRAAEGAIAADTTESLAAIETVKALGTEATDALRLRRRSRERRDAGVEASVAEGRFGGLVDVLEAIGTAAVLTVGVIRVSAGVLTPGDLVVMYSYVRRLYRPLRDLSRQAGRISRAMVRGERISEVLAADDTLRERPGAHTGAPAMGTVELRDVTFAYEARRPVLCGVSLHIPAGTTVAVVGESGAGKSTLAALLARFHDPDTGAVLLDGRDLRACKLDWVRRQVGFVLQDTALFTGTVGENLTYGTDATMEQAATAARAAGAHDFIHELPDGYDTDLGPGGAALSGGQRQRLAIARILLRDPAVVVLDEPTSGLDAASEHSVVESLERLLHGRTTILITHTLRLASRADRVVVFDHGRVVEDGSPQELLRGRGTFRRLAVQQGLAKPPAMPVPTDPALAQLATMLDTDAVAAVLGQHVGEHDPVLDVTLRYVRYKPATNVVVDYGVTTPTGTHRAVLMAAAGRNLARRAARPASRHLAAKVAGRVPGGGALGHAAELDALVQWLPLDIWLPALAERPEDLARAVGAQTEDPGQATLLAYKPRRRAVLRVDGHVLKLYADEADFRAASAALLAGPRLPVLTATPTGVAATLQLTGQHVMTGDLVEDPIVTAPEAGALLAALHRASAPVGSRRLDPLCGAMATADTVAALVPELSPRLDRLVGRLTAAAPVAGTALCHGDFHSSQLLTRSDGLAVLDLDEWGVGSPAADLATYAAHLLVGATDGVDQLDEALEALLGGYGRRPNQLDWHIAVAVLRRSVFPFRTLPTSEWPERVAAMVGTAEAVAAR